MKVIWLLILILSALPSFAQTRDQVLATATGIKITVGDLPEETAAKFLNLPVTLTALRIALLEEKLASRVFELEAKARGLKVADYIAGIRATVPDPTEADLREVYEANRAQIGDRDFASVKPLIVAALREEPEMKALKRKFEELKAKYKVVPGKDVNSINLRPLDVLATIAAKPLTVKEFEDDFRVPLYETKAKVFDVVKVALGNEIFNAVVRAEAASLNLTPPELIAREISDKLRDYTTEEREELEAALRQRLFTKYKTTILLKEPTAPVFSIGLENAAVKGPATAPVTVVMFSDFQCGACAATHAILARVLGDYGNKVRFAIRNFPLESLHEHAFDAARAAVAAKEQGKFFEFIELLYGRQTALDADSLRRYAAEVGLNMNRFELDFGSAKTAEIVRQDLRDGEKMGINSTPRIYVNGVQVRIITAAGIREAIDKALRKP
jgi:protein-disulfide isomerase